MSDLQISLLIIGVLVVGGVYLFNWFQERRFRRRIGQAFDAERDDVLLKTSAQVDGRVEPQLRWAGDAAAAPSGEENETGQAPSGSSGEGLAELQGFDPAIDYIAAIDSTQPILESAVDELLSRMAASGKPCHAAGRENESSPWEEVTRGAGDRYRQLRLALQLVSRGGPVNPAQLAIFCDAVRGCADRAGAKASCPDTHAALVLARELDGFCAEVDVAIGINIVAETGQAFPGTRIRTLAEAAGFRLEPDGVFHFRSEQRQTLFTLDNHEPAPFLPEQIQSLTTGGITLLLDVPRLANGIKVLGRMFEVARSLAQGLGGQLVDDNRVALNEAGVARIGDQLGQIYATMEGRGIPAGGPRALRLFS